MEQREVNHIYIHMFKYLQKYCIYIHICIYGIYVCHHKPECQVFLDLNLPHDFQQESSSGVRIMDSCLVFIFFWGTRAEKCCLQE